MIFKNGNKRIKYEFKINKDGEPILFIDDIESKESFDCLYEDNHVIAVYKDFGILSQEDSTKEPDLLNITKEYLKVKYNKPGDVYLGLVQRLDKNVSGIMVFARNSKSASRLNENRPVKHYLALVSGKVQNDEAEIINKISKDEKNKIAYLDNYGKEAILNYKLVDYKNNYSLLDVCIKTGRFHQIRFQLSNIGHPIVNDKKYGGVIVNNSYEIGLSAVMVNFIHPVSKENITLYRNKNNLINNFIKGE